MIPLLAVDVETRSLADLRRVGGRIYASDPTTQLIVAVFALKESEGSAWEVFELPTPSGRAAWPFGDVGDFNVLAHNGAGFDIHVWRQQGWPEPARLIDTAELARRAGMPQASLDWLGENLCGHPKDKEGNKLTLSLSRVSRKTGRWPELTPEILARVTAYCRSDVELMCRLWDEHLSPWDSVSELEDAVLEVDRRINDRGIAFDTELARVLIELDAQLAAKARADAGVGDPTDLRAPARFIAALEALGVYVGSAQKGEIEPLLEHPDERVAALAHARLAGSTIAAGKLKAGIERTSSDGRMRDNARYCGAHTGRWAGGGMQIQNLPK